MSRSSERFVWNVFGLTGSGKTFLVEQFLGAFQRPVIIPDTLAEWSAYGWQYDNPQALFRDVSQALALKKEWAPGGIYVLQPRDLEAVEAFFSLAKEWRVPGCYVCDEFHKYAPSGKRTPFLSMIQTGRHHSQSVVGITQRPQGVHNHAVEEAAITTFQLSGRAAEYLTHSRTGYMPQTLDAQDLQDLDPRQYVNGGAKWQSLPFGEALGDPDGSVWAYDAGEHVTEKVSDPAQTGTASA